MAALRGSSRRCLGFVRLTQGARTLSSDAELRYLSFSTEIPYEIVEYPDSGKVLVRAGDPLRPSFRYRGHLDAPREYWDGE